MGRTYFHLSLEERRRIAKWREARMPIAEIADRLGRDASTVYRDLRRNRYDDKELPELDGYYALKWVQFSDPHPATLRDGPYTDNQMNEMEIRSMERETPSGSMDINAVGS